MLNYSAYNSESIRCIMTAEYLRNRISQLNVGDNALFAGFIIWLRDNHPDIFNQIPILWQLIYNPLENTRYVGFRMVLDPNSKNPLPPQFFHDMVDDLFSQRFLRSIYPEGSLGKLFSEYKNLKN
ncbi:MAG TPA: hypothetical protein O0X99_01650 [Methanocorpusculum sp.]|nr:hypothetical protein [Methanocorpusculum sp.]